MREAQRTRQRAPEREVSDKTTALEFAYLHDMDEDRRRLRVAVTVAVIVHLAIFAMRLPASRALVEPPKNPKVFVVETTPRFKPPLPEKETLIPRPRTRKVPIPDPTPDAPEPIPAADALEPIAVLPNTDLLSILPSAPPPFPSDEPLQVGGDVKAPVKMFHPPPVYPEIARKARIQGVVVVRAVIETDGTVSQTEIRKGLPLGLDHAARDAIRRWRFKPATLNGKPVKVFYHLTVNFTLQ